MESIFLYKNYKKYLNDLVESLPKKGFGVRIKLAEHIGCSVTYISQVLTADRDLSQEQAESINRFFNHNEEESYYFLLLVQYNRAGTIALKEFLKKKLQGLSEQHLNLKNRLQVSDDIRSEDQSEYYSSWQYTAIHCCLLTPHLNTPQLISETLKLPLERTQKILDFLVRVGIAEKSGITYKSGLKRIHLGDDSPMLNQHHANWRVKTIERLQSQSDKKDLNYSSVICISEKDAMQIREDLVNKISELKKVIKESQEEKLYSFNVDFFGI